MISLVLIERHAKSRVTKDFRSVFFWQKSRVTEYLLVVHGSVLSLCLNPTSSSSTAPPPRPRLLSAPTALSVCVLCFVCLRARYRKHSFASRPDRKPRFPSTGVLNKGSILLKIVKEIVELSKAVIAKGITIG